MINAKRTLLAVAAMLALSVRPATAQGAAGSQATDTAHIAGKYDLSFTPQNGETITAQLTIGFRAGEYRGVLTSPKLSEPEPADSVRVTGHHVFVAALDGAYTFDFDVDGEMITHPTFSKSMRGATEQGSLSIRKRAP